MKTKLSPRFWCILTIFSLIGQIAWVVENMYFNVFVYKIFNASPSDISAMVAASAISATLTSIFIGTLSDKIGKRKVIICTGYILWGISIFAFVFLKTEVIEAIFPMALSAASVGVSLVIALDCVMTFFGSSANDAAFNAWLTDSTNSDNRGAAEGINSMMPLVAIIAVFGGFMAFNLDDPSSWTYIFAIIGGVTFGVGVLGCFIIKDPTITPSKDGYFKSIIYGFRPSSIKSHTHLYISLALFVLFNISIQIFMPYLIIYYEVSLGMSNYVFIMAPAIILASAATAFFGKLYDKISFRPAISIALASLITGYALLTVFTSTLPVFIGSLLMMCGYLCGMAVFGAIIRDKTPEGKAGMLQGIRIFSQVLVPGIVGPYIGSTVLANCQKIVGSDGTESFVPNRNIFIAAASVAVLLAVILAVVFSHSKNYGKKDLSENFCNLITPYEKDLTDVPYSGYPRPQLKRDSYMSLNGKWDLFGAQRKEEVLLGQITVPFPPESRLSSLGLSPDGIPDKLIYRRRFNLPDGFMKSRLILNFGAVDQISEIYLNGELVGKNTGGYIPFSFDITSQIKTSENELEVRTTDILDPAIPYGKQRRRRGGMWYTPISGIWQSVWLESVPQEYVRFLKITPSLTDVTIHVNGVESEKTLVLDTESGKEKYVFTGDEITIKVKNPKLWTPDSPNLYNFTLTAGEDTVSSYFALREVSIKKSGKYSYVCLNGEPIFLHGLLDQGYTSDGIYLPATPDGYKYDILKMKNLGFNMLRKHIKIEPDLFYYYCDVYGMIVMQDMVNNGKYSFLIDTALPTAFLRKNIVPKFTLKGQKENFIESAEKTVSHLYNHPSVCAYTIFNEGWGQHDCDAIYAKLKNLDTSRVWDATSGWFYGKESDVDSRHVYFKKIRLKASSERPLVLSEFGGYSCPISGHRFNLSGNYGYKICPSPEDFQRDLTALYKDEIIPAIRNGLAAAVLTQLSDVEDETNGLLTYDRQVMKVSQNDMQKISEEIYSEFSKTAADI